MDLPSSTSGYSFCNWAKSYSCSPELYFEPKDLKELRQILALAKLKSKVVKVVGNGHSPSDIACTSDYMISLKHFSRVLNVDVVEKRITVEGGILISDLNKALDQNGLALSILGSISEISLSGATATGTHGTGKDYGVLSTYIMEMELVCADGTVKTLSREKEPEVFLAAGVGLGAIGVIISMTLQCEPAYRLCEVKYGMSLQDVLENLDVHLSASNHFRAMWYPHTEECVVYHLSRTEEPISRKTSWFWDYFVGYFVLEFLYWISSFTPSIVPWINRTYYHYVHKGRTKTVDKSYRLFNFDCLFKQYVMEFAIPKDQSSLVLYRLKAWIENNFYAHLPVEIRFSKGDDFYLSPAYKRDTCFVNIIMYRPYSKKIPFEKYWSAYQEVMLDAGGRPHWAKDHTVSAEDLRRLYPEMEKFLEIRSRLDPNGLFLNDNLKRVFGMSIERSVNNHVK